MEKCPSCSRETPVPAPPWRDATVWAKTYPPEIYSIEVRFPCPECGMRLAMDGRNAGDPGLCPTCGKEIRCPDLSFLAVSASAPAPPARLSREEIAFLSEAVFEEERSVLGAA